MRLTLLGTGTPNPDPRRAGPSQLVEAGPDRILVDCGTGAVRRLVEAGHQPRDIELLFVTHMHSDHSIDLGHFLITRWIQFPTRPLTLVGPPGLREYRDNLLRLLDWDIRVRDLHTRLSDEARRVDVTEIDDGWTLERDHWRAAAIRVDHYPVEHAFGFRFDTDDASLVISGDTAPHEPLAKAAAGVNILVHEAWLKPRDEPARRHMSPDDAERFIGWRGRYHTDSHQVGKIAALADPGLLVLSHLGPIDTEVMAEHVSANFSRFVVGADLLTFDVAASRS
ncbi:MAG: MBL fold metallo-hydrolase, partial [Chloroflexota bacterium]